MAQEVQSPLTATSSPLSKNPELALVRSARQLRSAQLSDAASSIKETQLDPETRSEIIAALQCTDKSTFEQGLQTLEELVRTAPNRRRARSLLRYLVAAEKKDTVAQLLDEMEPGDSILTLSERLLLCTYAGKELGAIRDELAEMYEATPELAFAIAPTEESALSDEVSTDAIRSQLGSALALLSGTSDCETRTRALELANTAVQLLTEREQEPEVRAALGLVLGPAKNSPLEQIRSIEELSLASEQQAGLLLAAALGEGLKDPQSERLWEQLLADGGEFSLAAGHFLARTSGESGALKSLVQSEEEPRLKLSIALQQILADAGRASTGATARELAAILLEYYREEANPAVPPMLAVAESHLRQESEIETADLIRESFCQRPSSSGDISQLRRWFEVGPQDGEALELSTGPLAAHSDSSFRALAIARSPDRAGVVGQLNPENAATDTASPHSANERHQAIAQSLRLGAMDEVGAQCVELPEDLEAQALLQNADEATLEMSRLTPHFLELARNGTAEERRYAYERLAELDAMRDDESAALLWLRSLAEEFPEHLPSLVRFEELQLSQGQSLGKVREKLAERLPPGDREGYRTVPGAEALSQLNLRDAQKHLEASAGW